MAPQQLQDRADTDEMEARSRYDQRRLIAGVIAEAARRADATSRLEAWLRYQPAPARRAA